MQKEMAPIMKKIPALSAQFILQIMKKTKRPPMTNKVKKVPYTGKTIIIILPSSRSLIIVPILQNENTKNMTQMAIQRILQFSTSLISTCPSEISSAMLRKLTTQIMWPTRKESAPIAKKAKLIDCNSKRISPSEPKASATMSDFMELWLFLTVQSSAIMIHTGMGLANLKGVMLQWSVSPIMQSAPKMTKQISMIMQKYPLQKVAPFPYILRYQFYILLYKQNFCIEKIQKFGFLGEISKEMILMSDLKVLYFIDIYTEQLQQNSFDIIFKIIRCTIGMQFKY